MIGDLTVYSVISSVKICHSLGFDSFAGCIIPGLIMIARMDALVIADVDAHLFPNCIVAGSALYQLD
jgi:hypothetical protein